MVLNGPKTHFSKQQGSRYSNPGHHFDPFRLILILFYPIMALFWPHFCPIFAHCGPFDPFLSYFEPFWACFAPFWSIFTLFWLHFNIFDLFLTYFGRFEPIFTIFWSFFTTFDSNPRAISAFWGTKRPEMTPPRRGVLCLAHGLLWHRRPYTAVQRCNLGGPWDLP